MVGVISGMPSAANAFKYLYFPAFNNIKCEFIFLFLRSDSTLEIWAGELQLMHTIHNTTLPINISECARTGPISARFWHIMVCSPSCSWWECYSTRYTIYIPVTTYLYMYSQYHHRYTLQQQYIKQYAHIISYTLHLTLLPNNLYTHSIRLLLAIPVHASITISQI